MPKGTYPQASCKTIHTLIPIFRLSYYARIMVSTERDRCRRFEDSLHYDIRSRLTLGDTHNYQDLRAAATRVKRLLKENEKYQAARTSKRSASSQGGETSGRPGKKQWRNNSTQSYTRDD